MAARTGEQFLKGLKGKREIWLGAEKVWELYGATAGRTRRRPSWKTARHSPSRRLWRLGAGLSNPKPRPSSSDAKEASWKASREGSQNEAWPF